jgi:N-alpha-acetyltransferase 15/16, NatA auxiliary subunit
MNTTPDNNPQTGAGRPLPKKESDIFRAVIKQYESKQYKKAIKQAELILKKFPNHGETLAMKGLALNSIPTRKEEALPLVKQGLMNDMRYVPSVLMTIDLDGVRNSYKAPVCPSLPLTPLYACRSHVCWHVLGLLHRANNDYNEAIKAYKQALRIDPENSQILRDLSSLQLQMRDLDGFVATRTTLLNLKPSLKLNWLAFALGKHLVGHLSEAVHVIDTYLGTLTEGSGDLARSFESSELAMYKNMVLAEIPDNYQSALEHLTSCENIVMDRGAWLRRRAELQLKLEDYGGAIDSILSMFRRGMTEDHTIHSLYMFAVLKMGKEVSLIDEVLSVSGTNTLVTVFPLSNDQRRELSEAYASELGPEFTSSHAVQRIPYTFVDCGSDELRCIIDLRCRLDLARGVPSLCAELYSFVRTLDASTNRLIKPDDPVDLLLNPTFAMLQEMADRYITSLSSCAKFSDRDKEEQDPSTLLWAWYLRASLYELVGNYSAGIELLDKCLLQDSSAVDVYELKARLLLSMGDAQAAVECLDIGRELDRQDRYINNQTTRYLLRAGMEEQALKTILMV